QELVATLSAFTQESVKVRDDAVLLLIKRFYDPVAGDVPLDGHDFYLFTIAANTDYDLSIHTEIEKTAKKANAHAQSPDGYDKWT
ncbi:hypothetical protein PHYBOEH_010145, partial [Phytophthora boehmeriae]